MHYSQRLLAYIKRAEQASQAAKEVALRDTGITPAQQTILAVLIEAPGITGAELARRCAITPQTITASIARLEAAGLVERRSHSVHRTLIEIHPTRRGTEIFARADQQVADLDAVLSDGLSKTELATLSSLLTRVTDASQDYLTRTATKQQDS
ncbi:MarR family transcriptional regulator [Rugosimonospora acidiphila]|uniref:MarR family transcriptional regulator n=1 Tax=Rugosimonospora acidiphila TaxID=556531 RepID=A0ABP9RPB2_9ACTN